MTTTADKPKKPREKIPKTVVLDWLMKTHPALHATAELDRDWVWLTENLSGDSHKEIRESLKNAAPGRGFVFAKKGGHKLPSGKLGTWGHSCDKPMPFKRRGGSKGNSNTPATPESEAPAKEDSELNEALQFAMGE